MQLERVRRDESTAEITTSAIDYDAEVPRGGFLSWPTYAIPHELKPHAVELRTSKEIADHTIMWRLKSGEESQGHPFLRSLNNFQGRQVWEYDVDGGSPDELQAVKAAQEAFTANRLTQKHSSDLLLRLQSTGSIEDSTIRRRHGWKSGVQCNSYPR